MDDRERSIPADRADAAAASASGDARGLFAEWLALTAKLLGDLRVSVADLQELLAAQGRVFELVERSAEHLPRASNEDYDATIFRKVL